MRRPLLGTALVLLVVLGAGCQTPNRVTFRSLIVDTSAGGSPPLAQYAQWLDTTQPANNPALRAQATPIEIDGTDSGPDVDFVLNGNLGQSGTNASLEARRASLGNTPATSSQPTSLTVSTGQGLTEDAWMNQGTAEVFFGGAQSADVFTSAFPGGFFEFRITDRDATDDTVSGTFQFLGRNNADPNDPRLLLILEGAFSTEVD